MHRQINQLIKKFDKGPVISNKLPIREAIIWAYRLFLDREPENPQVVTDKMGIYSSTKQLRKDFMGSLEYQTANPGSPYISLSGDEPKMPIEYNLSDEDLRILFNHIQDTWQHLGETEPHWSILTSPDYYQSNISQTQNIFFETGKRDVVHLFKVLERNEIDYSGFKSCLEYGCGVGRVTRWFAENFETVHGYDISKSHLDLAQKYLDSSNITNVELHHIKNLEDIKQLPKVDLIYSVIVLQHNPPPLIGFIIRSFFNSLNPSGVAFFQVPTYRLGYSFSAQSYLHTEASQQNMEMHVFPQNKIFEIAKEEWVRIIELIEDDWTGSRNVERSNSFLLQKEL